jgi:hypothetical protein
VDWAAPVGRAPSRPARPFPRARKAGPRTAMGRFDSTGRPSFNNKNRFLFSFIILDENELENILAVISAPKIMK